LTNINMVALQNVLACPICGAPFTWQQTTLVCANAHAFDIAREGYVNLLRKKLPGDTKEMLLARRSFLEQGYYQPLSMAINILVENYLVSSLQVASSSSPLYVLDAGCGEGYYLGRLQAHFAMQRWPLVYLGIDISKEAIRLAAKRYKDVYFLVANLKERLVLMDAVAQVMLNIFAPRNVQEYARVLAPGGLLLIVIPGPTHLQQLRSALHLLNIEEHKQQHVIEQFSGLFELLTTQTLAYTLRLQSVEIERAVMMTPNNWHLSTETRGAMELLEEIETEVEFICLLFRRQITV
jgi:23S rRNA (guanine745-N1)-methyltransferase